MAEAPLIGITLDHQESGSFSKRPHYAVRTAYFEAIAEWYRALRVGAVGGDLAAIIERRLAAIESGAQACPHAAAA
jgi:hypothetical protein